MNPNTLRADGSCPSCHRKVADPPRPSTSVETEEAGTEIQVDLVPDLPDSATEVPKAPWHFKLLVVATVVYLVWRFADMFGWAIS